MALMVLVLLLHTKFAGGLGFAGHGYMGFGLCPQQRCRCILDMLFSYARKGYMDFGLLLQQRCMCVLVVVFRLVCLLSRVASQWFFALYGCNHELALLVYLVSSSGTLC